MNRLKHIANALTLGALAGLNLGCALIGSLAALAEVMSATSGKKKVVSGEITMKDIPEKEETGNAGEAE